MTNLIDYFSNNDYYDSFYDPEEMDYELSSQSSFDWETDPAAIYHGDKRDDIWTDRSFFDQPIEQYLAGGDNVEERMQEIEIGDDYDDSSWLDDFRKWRDDNIAGEILDFAAGAMRATKGKQQAGMQRRVPTRSSRGASMPSGIAQQLRGPRETESLAGRRFSGNIEQQIANARRNLARADPANKISLGDFAAALLEPKPSGTTIKSSDYKIARLASRLT